MVKSAASAPGGSHISESPSLPDMGLRLANIETMIQHIYRALFGEEVSCEHKQVGCVHGEKQLKPFDAVRFQAALIEARRGNHKALIKYLKEYKPRPRD